MLCPVNIEDPNGSRKMYSDALLKPEYQKYPFGRKAL